MTADVRQQLTEALQQAEDLARTAMGHQVFDGTGIVTMSPTLTGLHRSVVIEGNVATFLRRWDPATVLRLVERDRDLLNEWWSTKNAAGRLSDYGEGRLEILTEQVNAAAAFWLGTPERPS